MAKKVFNMQGGLHSAAAYSAFENRLFGSCVANAASFVVTPGAGMNLSISSGDGLISVDNFNARRIQTTTAENALVSAASASFNRIDTLVAYIDTTVAPTTAVIDNINDILMFKVVPGTAAATPLAPTGAAIQASIGAGNPYMVLYDALIPQNAANVAGVTLTDRRSIASVVSRTRIADNAIDGSKIQLANNDPIVALNTGGVEKMLAKLGTNDQLRLGQIKNKQNTTVTTEDSLYIQTGWGYVQGNGSAGITAMTTFAEPFDQLLGHVFIMSGVKANAGVPTGPTDGGSAAAEYFTGGGSASNTGFGMHLRHPTGVSMAAGVYWIYSYIAWGRKA